MKLSGRHIVVTGAAGGIGRALAARFAAEGARAITIADRDGPGVAEAGRALDAFAVCADLTTEDAVVGLIDQAESHGGPVDVFVSNAGFVAAGGLAVGETDFEASWALHVMAHVWASRRLVPAMVSRGGGYLVVTASAAGLLSNVRSLPYTLTKHAAVALAEWLSITYGDAGIRSSCICPLGVRTDLLFEDPVATGDLASGRKLDPSDVADAVIVGMAHERCLILPHGEVEEYVSRKALDHERWLRGMRALNQRMADADELAKKRLA
jgi:NAD(P)-dependent dehydrogenase (short-subunit alcohol dehydrogenase family)